VHPHIGLHIRCGIRRRKFTPFNPGAARVRISPRAKMRPPGRAMLDAGQLPVQQAVHMRPATNIGLCYLNKPSARHHDQVAKRLRDIPAKSRGGDSYEGIPATSDYHLSIVALVGRLQSARVLNRGGSTICWETVLNHLKAKHF
jgi:hypothetical protein